MFMSTIFVVSAFVMVGTQELPHFWPPFPAFAQPTSTGGLSSQVGGFSSTGSQVSSAYSSAYAGFGGESSPGYQEQQSSPGDQSPDIEAAIRDPRVEAFARRLLLLVETSPAIDVPNYVIIPDVYEAVYEVGLVILVRNGIKDTSYADTIAQETERSGMVTLDQNYNIWCHLIAILLRLRGRLTQEVLLDGPDDTLFYIEKYAYEHGADDVLSAMLAVSNGIFDQAEAQGLVNLENIPVAFRVYLQYTKDLEDGEFP